MDTPSAKLNVIAAVILEHLCELNEYSDVFCRLVFMDIYWMIYVGNHGTVFSCRSCINYTEFAVSF